MFSRRGRVETVVTRLITPASWRAGQTARHLQANEPLIGTTTTPGTHAPSRRTVELSSPSRHQLRQPQTGDQPGNESGGRSGAERGGAGQLRPSGSTPIGLSQRGPVCTASPKWRGQPSARDHRSRARIYRLAVSRRRPLVPTCLAGSCGACLVRECWARCRSPAEVSACCWSVAPRRSARWRSASTARSPAAVRQGPLWVTARRWWRGRCGR